MSTDTRSMNQPPAQPATQSRADRFSHFRPAPGKLPATVSLRVPDSRSNETVEVTGAFQSAGSACLSEVPRDVKADEVSSPSGGTLSQAGETVWLDPTLIRPSQFANRHHGDEKAFLRLSEDIRATTGNLVPIKVRALDRRDADGHAYEIVYGHRRHRACLANGLRVLAMVVALDDRQLFLEMLKENETRESLGTYDKALMLQASMKTQLFSTQAELAQSIGMQASVLSRYIRLAELPKEVVQAFSSPNDIRLNWVPALSPPEVLDRARFFGASLEPRAAKNVYAALTGQPFPATAKITCGQKEFGFWIESGHALTLKIDLRHAPHGWRDALRKGVSKALGAEFVDSPDVVTAETGVLAGDDTVCLARL